MSVRDMVSLGYDEYGMLMSLVIIIEPDLYIPRGYELKLNRAQFIALRDAITQGLARGEVVE